VDEVQLALDGAFRTIFLVVVVLGGILLATGRRSASRLVAWTR
jgi:hypothetical protein